ncbi:MAG: hypothetical protein SGPRY_002511, partial [Prymnesium sp.]
MGIEILIEIVVGIGIEIQLVEGIGMERESHGDGSRRRGKGWLASHSLALLSRAKTPRRSARTSRHVTRGPTARRRLASRTVHLTPASLEAMKLNIEAEQRSK